MKNNFNVRKKCLNEENENENGEGKIEWKRRI